MFFTIANSCVLQGICKSKHVIRFTESIKWNIEVKDTFFLYNKYGMFFIRPSLVNLGAYPKKVSIYGQYSVSYEDAVVADTAIC